MPALKDLLPLLFRARASLEHGYELLLQAAEHEAIPCDAVTVYTNLRRFILRLETAIVREAKIRQLHPPEDVPRAFALLGACPPGREEIPLDRETRDLGKNHVDAVKQRAKLSDAAIRAGYEDPAFQAHAKQMIEWLAPLAKAGTDEAAPAPPRNLALLRVVYFLGGTIWPVMEAEKLLHMEMDVVSTEDAIMAFRQAGQFENAAQALVEDTAPPPPLLSKKGWIGVGLGLATAAASLGGLGWYLHRKPPDLQGEDAAPYDETGPWPDLPRGKERRALPAHDEGET